MTDSEVPSVVTVAFDQNGDPYPFDPNTHGLELPSQPENTNTAFSLAKWYADRAQTYDRAQQTSAIAGRIDSQLAAHPNARLVFLIHGFNHSFERGRNAFLGFREELAATGSQKDLVFVQVHWDGLFKGKGTAPAPLTYWGKSLTYSNLAGMCGLRDILNRVSVQRDTTFVTHSRGVAVALGAATDPLFDKGIERCSAPGRPTSPSSDVRLIAYAPAVGDGHMRDSDGNIELGHYDYFDKFYAGFRPNDSATSKTRLGLRIGGRRGGDTRLGSNRGYIELIKSGAGNRFDYVTFGGNQHSWASYLDERQMSECLMWAGKLISSRPENCELLR